MNNLKIDEAMAYVRKIAAKNNGDVPEWNKYQELLKEHFKDPFNTKFKMPQEYYYAYLRGKNMSHEEALERMGISIKTKISQEKKKSFWKFW
ncbi:hypothetical protein H8K32_17980 [Undibacterium jejuense]|uniref:Uncharacterized protein n=2 Tax=Undibacterium jejuense TaxID=1344949 RepID=A0A923KMC1_9BURK|nr:hypothetical protein [Undibacterium jejuense]